MAKVKIQGHASGTGILTVTAPNTSTDRTITLPDATGTLLNSDGSGANLTSLPNGSQLDHSGTKKFEANALGVTLTGTAGTSPVLELNNADTEDNDTGRETSIRFTGNRSGGEDVINAQISGHHDGSADDDKGMMLFYTNGGSGSVQQLKITNDGRGLSGFTAKAWCKMEGTGTPSFFGTPHNCSSITDNSTGHYTLNLTNAMANSNGSAVGSCVAATSGSDNRLACCTVTATNTIDVRTGHAANGTYIDVAVASIIVFGD